jgi:uroporphyrinogen-III synthase
VIVDVPADRPLTGVRIAVTRAGERGGPLAEMLRYAGATVHEVPLTRIESLDPAPLARAVDSLADYAWVLLTSANAVAHLAAAITSAISVSQLKARKLAVVGSATADAAAQQGWNPTLVPERFNAEALVDAMASRTDVDGARMLYPSALAARDVLPTGLRALGAIVDVVPVYRSAVDAGGQAQLRALAIGSGLDLVTVAAPSAVDALLDAVPAEFARRLPVACIGPVTARAARLAGFPVKVESTASTMDGLARSIVAAFRPSR